MTFTHLVGMIPNKLGVSPLNSAFIPSVASRYLQLGEKTVNSYNNAFSPTDCNDCYDSTQVKLNTGCPVEFQSRFRKTSAFLITDLQRFSASLGSVKRSARYVQFVGQLIGTWVNLVTVLKS